MEFKKSLPPGTVFNTSDKKMATKIKKIYYNGDQISIDQPIPDSQLWVKVSGLGDSQRIVEELRTSNIDYLVIEDIFNLTQRAKIEEIDNGFLAVLKITNHKEKKFTHEYLSIILKDNIVYTFDEDDTGILNIIEDRLMANQGNIKTYPAKFLFYTIIDTLIDINILFENEIGRLIIDWEEKILVDKKKEINDLHQIRKEVLLMKTHTLSFIKSLETIKDIYKHPAISELKKYYTDLFDHLYRLSDRLNIDIENIRTLNDIHQNNINERTNSIMKILTIFSATFIPLSFLAGVFGMNFVYMEIFSNPNGVWIFIGMCLTIFLLMLGFFKYKKWF
jgi:magnesium transporter